MEMTKGYPIWVLVCVDYGTGQVWDSGPDEHNYGYFATEELALKAKKKCEEKFPQHNYYITTTYVRTEED